MSVLDEILNSSAQIFPEWILFSGILIMGLAITFTKPESKIPFYIIFITVIFYGYSVIISNQIIPGEGLRLYQDLIYLDRLSLFIKQLCAVATIIFLVHARLFSYPYSGEIYFLILCLLIGISFLSMTTHFMTLFVSLEMISISSYVLVASGKTKNQYEAGIKYLIFGATASAIMLLGMSYFYGVGHGLNFSSSDFILKVSQNPKGPIQAISFMVLGGFFFKIAAAPFHQWVPDVYETTSTPIISFLSFAPKAVGFVVISRFISAGFADLTPVLLIVITLSLIVGNFSALWQNNLKRLLGYSGIAQSGFILIGLIKTENHDFYGTFFYILTYLPMTMGSFFLADLLFKKAGTFDIPSLAGLGKKYPILSINALIILVSLIGLPPTVGFMAKLIVFSSLTNAAAHQNNYLFYALVIFGLMNAAISIYYYLRPAYYILVKDSDQLKSDYSFDFFVTIILSYFSFSLIYLFFKPEFISEWVRAVVF